MSLMLETDYEELDGFAGMLHKLSSFTQMIPGKAPHFNLWGWYNLGTKTGQGYWKKKLLQANPSYDRNAKTLYKISVA